MCVSCWRNHYTKQDLLLHTSISRPRMLDVGQTLQIAQIVYSANSTSFQKINLFVDRVYLDIFFFLSGCWTPNGQDVIRNFEPLSLAAVWDKLISAAWKQFEFRRCNETQSLWIQSIVSLLSRGAWWYQLVMLKNNWTAVRWGRTGNDSQQWWRGSAAACGLSCSTSWYWSDWHFFNLEKNKANWTPSSFLLPPKNSLTEAWQLINTNGPSDHHLPSTHTQTRQSGWSVLTKDKVTGTDAKC